jgi:hypothetical protein
VDRHAWQGNGSGHYSGLGGITRGGI